MSHEYEWLFSMVNYQPTYLLIAPPFLNLDLDTKDIKREGRRESQERVKGTV